VSDVAQAAVARAGRALWRRVGPEVLLAAADGSQIDRLSVPASALWLRLERPLGRDRLIAALAEDFEADPADIAAHVDRLLEELGARGWVGPADRADG
jgi:hypothetical protein